MSRHLPPELGGGFMSEKIVCSPEIDFSEWTFDGDLPIFDAKERLEDAIAECVETIKSIDDSTTSTNKVANTILRELVDDMEINIRAFPGLEPGAEAQNDGLYINIYGVDISGWCASWNLKDLLQDSFGAVSQDVLINLRSEIDAMLEKGQKK